MKVAGTKEDGKEEWEGRKGGGGRKRRRGQEKEKGEEETEEEDNDDYDGEEKEFLAYKYIVSYKTCLTRLDDQKSFLAYI